MELIVFGMIAALAGAIVVGLAAVLLLNPRKRRVATIFLVLAGGGAAAVVAGKGRLDGFHVLFPMWIGILAVPAMVAAILIDARWDLRKRGRPEAGS